jgi:hypothetical protein
MSTWRIEDAEEVKEVEDVEDAYSGAAESCLARKLASLGIALQVHYTSKRIKSESVESKFYATHFPH